MEVVGRINEQRDLLSSTSAAGKTFFPSPIYPPCFLVMATLKNIRIRIECILWIPKSMSGPEGVPNIFPVLPN